MSHRFRPSIVLELIAALLLLPSVIVTGPDRNWQERLHRPDACGNNSGLLGASACVGLLACHDNSGTLAGNSRSGEGACVGNRFPQGRLAPISAGLCVRCAQA